MDKKFKEDFFKNYRYHLTLKQMRTIFGLCSEIAKKFDVDREEAREALKLNFCELKQIPYFSCSPYEFDALGYEDAKEFIEYLNSKV